MGLINFQPSELAKLGVLMYAANYMVRKMEVKEKFFTSVAPMGIAVAVVGLLLLAEPDMGAFMVIAVIAMGILFLGGVNARMFFIIGVLKMPGAMPRTRRRTPTRQGMPSGRLSAWRVTCAPPSCTPM